MTKKIFFPILALVFMLVFFSIYNKKQKEIDNPTKLVGELNSFNDCIKQGNLVMESYPRQCRSKDGRLFIENIGNILEKTDLIRTNFPMPNQIVSSPLEITGEARGFWYFEADFPVILLDAQENIIARGIAVAQDNWMTEEFVPFLAKLEFIQPASESVGELILEKDNPSGLLENNDSLNIPIIFK